MTADVHKITAGSGYLYLSRQVARADATQAGRMSLSAYYTEKGESPGRWMGRGLSALGDVAAGSQVTEAQMEALFGFGLHPNSSQPLGRPFRIVYETSELDRRLAVAFSEHNVAHGRHWAEPVEDDAKAAIRTRVATGLFAQQYGRPPGDDRELAGFIARESRESTISVAGYDLTFTPVKSVSVLWALAPLQIAQAVERCHYMAVADALDYMQDHACFARTGAGGVAQVDTAGVIIAAFTHRDSRAGDPNLHTHCAASGKVRALDGRWLALDGRVLFKAKVAISEVYNTRLEAHLVAELGLSFAERAMGAGKRPVREVVGVSERLCARLSSRRELIEARYAQLAGEFQAAHGREPIAAESLALYQTATLQTRQAKHEPRSLAQQRGVWRGQAVQVLGGPAQLAAMLGDALSRGRKRSRRIDDKWVARQAAGVVETVSQNRAVWQRTHVFAEAQRQVRAHDLHHVEGLAERITESALGRCVTWAVDLDAELGEPASLRRRDGSSVYSVHGAQLYTSEAVLAAERRILGAARLTGGRRVSDGAVGLALLEATANGRTLNPGQEALVRDFTCSGRRLALALAPPGAGKTTAMAAVASAWREDGGHVVGLAASARAAAVLRNDMAGQGVQIEVDTVDKLVWLTRNKDKTRLDPARKWFDRIGPRTVLIVDEAGRSGTAALADLVGFALDRGASVRLVGDNKQLSSIASGGVLTDIARDVGAVTLSEVMRFDSQAEAAAVLALRDGDPAGLGFYADHHRIHVGADATAADMAFAAWVADREKGWDSLLLAPTHDVVAALNERARAHRLAASGGPVALATAGLSDGLRASVGDLVATRDNARHLRLRGGRDYVRNGYRWQVTKVLRGGALRVARVGTRHTVTLPADYVKAHTTLGYASTIDAAQGDTIGSRQRPGTCHMVGGDRLTRQQVTTGLSRGTAANHVYLSTAEADPHRILSPKATHPETAIDVLTRALGRDDAQVSATSAAHDAADVFKRLAPAATRYMDAVWRSGEPGGVGPLQWLPAIPDSAPKDLAEYLAARAFVVTGLADQVRAVAYAWDVSSAPVWARPLLSAPRMVAEIAVFRAAHGVPDTDSRIVGPAQSQPRAAKLQGMWREAIDRLIGAGDARVSRWRDLVDDVDVRVRRDAYWPLLAAKLSDVARTGTDVRAVLADAARAGPLPDEMPAAALLWRLCGAVGPAVLKVSGQRLRPPWMADLEAVFGSALAETIAADPAFPGLVAAVAAADHRLCGPRELLSMADERLRDGGAVRPDEYARLLAVSIDLFTSHRYEWAPTVTVPPVSLEEEEMLAAEAPLSIEEEEMLADDMHETVQDFSAETAAAPVPLPEAVADVRALRRGLADAEKRLASLRAAVTQGRGPAMLAADSRLLELRARADADRPYRMAVQEVVAQWADAEVAYRQDMDAARTALDQALLSGDEDQVASARSWVALVQMGDPAARFAGRLDEAVAARFAAAPAGIVDAEDVEAARRAVASRDDDELAECARRRDEARRALDAAEAATVAAFAASYHRCGDYIAGRTAEVDTELRVLDLAAGVTRGGGVEVSQSDVAHLGLASARAVVSLARHDYTVSVAHAAGDAAEALDVFTAAMRASGRAVVTDMDAQLGIDDVLVVERANMLEPQRIREVAERAERYRARVVLLDDGLDGPSGGLLRMLERDLPWSVTLSAAASVRRRERPDLDAVLVQAARFDTAVLPDSVVAALGERARLRQARAERFADDEQQMQRGIERGLGLG